MAFTKAGLWGPQAIIDSSGHPQPGAAAALYLPDGVTLASLWTTSAKSVAVANPTQADIHANLHFWTDPGQYRLRVNVGTVVTWLDVEVPIDPGEAAQDQDVVAAQAAAEAYADGIVAAALAAALAASQPLDADLTAIAALATTAFGRALLILADAAALRAAAGLGTAATHAVGDFDAAGTAAAAVAAVVAGAPGALDTLNELATALADDANFATTVTNALATKVIAGATSGTANQAALPAAVAHTHEIVKTDDGGVYLSTGSSWVEVVPPSLKLAPTAVKTGNYTAAVGDYVLADTSGGIFTVTLPTAPADKTSIAVDLVASGNTLTIARGGADVFQKAGGPTALTMNTANRVLVLQYQSSIAVWHVQDHLPAVITTKGDLLTYGTERARLAVGADGALLGADSTQATGLKWIPSGTYASTANFPFNVKDAAYGASGDGVTYDHAAITAALDAAEAAYIATGQRQKVTLPAGHYRVSFSLAHTRPTGYAVFVTGCIKLRGGVDIEGPGIIVPDPIPTAALTSQLASGDTTMHVDSTTGFGSVTDLGMQLQFATTTTVGTFSGITPTTLTGVSYTGPTLPIGTAVTQRVFRCVFITDCTNEITDWSVTNVGIDGGNTAAIEQIHEGFFVGPSKRWSIDRCRITGLQGKGVHVVGEVGGAARIPSLWEFTRNEVRSISGNAVGYAQAGTADFLVADNRFTNNLIGGAESVIAGTQTAIDRGIIRNNRVINYGDVAATGRDMIVEGNTIVSPSTATGPGITAANGRNIKIIGNTIDMSAASGGNSIGVTASTAAIAGLTIADNSVRRNSDASGIATQLSSGTHTDLVVAGNTVSNASSSLEADISINQATGGTITGNTCRSNLGIWVKVGSARVAVVGNVVTAGEILISGATCTVEGNIAVGAAATGCCRLLGAGAVCTGNYFKGNGTNVITGVILVTGTDWIVTGNVLENGSANQRWISEEGAADRNIYRNNKLIGASGNNSIIGASSRFDNVESVRTLTKAGVPADSDFTGTGPTPGDGTLGVDLTGQRIYARINGAWVAPAPTAHHATHESGGSDAVTIAESQVTNLISDLGAKVPLVETVTTVAASGAAQTIPDPANGTTINRITLTANCTFTFPTAAAGKSFTLVLVEDGTGSRLATWPGTVKWPGGVAPTLSTGAGKIDYFTFVCSDGTNWAGFASGLDMR